MPIPRTTEFLLGDSLIFNFLQTGKSSLFSTKFSMGESRYAIASPHTIGIKMLIIMRKLARILEL